MPDTPVLPRGMRKLIIRGETWGWRFGMNIQIADPHGKRFKINLRDITGLDWHAIERDSAKKSFVVNPQKIVNYIDRKILGYKDATGFPKGVLPRDWQQTLRDGWKGVQGPRGLWQWKPDPVHIHIRSPEDVFHYTRMYNLLDMTVEEFASMKEAAIIASGSTMDEEIRKAGEKEWNNRHFKGFFGWEGPGLLEPTDKQVLAHIERHMGGIPEKAAL